MNRPLKNYHSFMIRLWFELRDGQENKSWQIELESIQTGQTHQFSAPQAMFGFLMDQLEFESQAGLQPKQKP